MAHFIVITINEDPKEGSPGNVAVNTQWSEGFPIVDVVGILASTYESVRLQATQETAKADIITPDGQALFVPRNGDTPEYETMPGNQTQGPNHDEA